MTGDPKTDVEALFGPEGEQWRKGLYEEYDNFFNRDAWEMVERQAWMQVLGTKNVYKKKLHALTKAIRYKVRSVIQGYSMIHGVHYEETFAPTPTNQTSSTMLAVSLYKVAEATKSSYKKVKDHWMIAQSIDVQAAFLEAKMDVDVFAALPPYFEDYCKWKGIPYDANKVIKINRAQCGSKDAGHRWMKLFIKLLTEEGGPGLNNQELIPVCSTSMTNKDSWC